MGSLKNNSYSTLAIVLILAIVILFGFKVKKWEEDRIIIHDVISYYAYLPAAIIHHDLKFDFLDETSDTGTGQKIWTKEAPNGNRVLKMTMGNSVCWLPFFLIGHVYTTLSGNWLNNGYSLPYSFMIAVAAFFYLFVGLFFLRKLLLMFYSDLTVAVVLIGIVLGTNLFYYTAVEPGMGHVYSFALISLFLYLSLKWISQLTLVRGMIIGLVLGLIVLIRVTNILVVIVPAGYIWFDQHSVSEKLGFLRKNIAPILVACLFTFLVFFIQMIYWKSVTGTWLYYSYGEEQFYFTSPHILKGLFSYRKGWLLYTPIMLFSFVGLFYLKKYAKGLTLPIIIFVIINSYVMYSWWCWWYGGGFGSRPMIDSYAVMALPMGAFVESVFSKRSWKTIVFFVVFSFLLYLNQFQIKQYLSTLLHYDSMSKEVYWKIFLKNKWPENYDKLIKPPDYDAAVKGKKEYQ